MTERDKICNIQKFYFIVILLSNILLSQCKILQNNPVIERLHEEFFGVGNAYPLQIPLILPCKELKSKKRLILFLEREKVVWYKILWSNMIFLQVSDLTAMPNFMDLSMLDMKLAFWMTTYLGTLDTGPRFCSKTLAMTHS